MANPAAAMMLLCCRDHNEQAFAAMALFPPAVSDCSHLFIMRRA
jgi:hypothetical protein